MTADLKNNEKVELLNNVIKSRHSTRKFMKESPERSLIDLVVEAGIYAPYSGLAGMKLEELRRIIVLTPGIL